MKDFPQILSRLREPEVGCACGNLISPFQSYLIGCKEGMSKTESLGEILTCPLQLL